MMRTLSLYGMAIFYVLAGVNHFIKPGFYAPMMPPFLPWPMALIYVSGVCEIALGLGLVPVRTRRLSALGLILLLLAVFPANVYMLYTGGAGYDFPQWGLWLRLPLQGLLIYWAYTHSRSSSPRDL